MLTSTPHSTLRSAPDAGGLAARLKKCASRGKLTTADLALWLGRPFPTVRMWANGFTQPSGPRAAGIWPKLIRLEKMIAEHRGLPIPDDVGHFDRPAYIKRLMSGRNRLPGSSAPKRRRRPTVRVRSSK